MQEVGPRLGALGGAQDAGDVQVGRPQVPGLVGVDVEPELVEMAEEVVVQQGDTPPAGGVPGEMGLRWLKVMVEGLGIRE